jgi:hypothetical protein
MFTSCALHHFPSDASKNHFDPRLIIYKSCDRESPCADLKVFENCKRRILIESDSLVTSFVL